MNIPQNICDDHVVIARHAHGSDGASGIVCILSVDHEYGDCEIALCHGLENWAGENDRILASEDTGLPYTLVVENDVRGYTYTDKIEEIITIVPSTFWDSAPRGAEGPHNPLDARWNFKVAEISRFYRLTSKFLRDLLEDCVEEVS